MKVCIVSHEYPPNVVSGLGTALTGLVEGLVEEGLDVTIVTPMARGGIAHEKKGRLEIFRIETAPGASDPRIAFSSALKRFKKGFEFTRFDLLHIYDVHDSYFLDRDITKRVPVIISVNDFYSYITPLNPFRFPYPCEGLLKRYLHYSLTRHLNKKYIRMADLILANTNYVKKILVEMGIADEERVSVVRRYMDPGRFSPDMNKYHSHEILYIGNNMERKGVAYLLEAMPVILERFPDARLIIVGSAQRGMKRKIDSVIKKYGLEKKVELIPFMSVQEVNKRYAMANVFVLPAIIENLAVVLLEAMASLTPVVCTSVGANSEAVDDSCGFLIGTKNPVEIAERVIEIFSNPARAREMGRAGKRIIEKRFRKDSMVKGVIGDYNRVTGDR